MAEHSLIGNLCRDSGVTYVPTHHTIREAAIELLSRCFMLRCDYLAKAHFKTHSHVVDQTLMLQRL